MTTRAFVVISKEKTNISDGWTLPSIRSDECVIQVSHCGLNFADLLMIRGTYQDTPEFPFAPGMEVCGEVISVGDRVTRVKKGDRIAAFCGHGGLANHVNVAADRCILLPETMPSHIAAGFQIAYGTSHLALTRRARLQPGETLVVLGAAGGVGLTAVEIGHAMGARVIAVARGAEKRAIAERAGADLSIDAETDDLRTALKAVGPVHVVYDAVGGALGEAALRTLEPEGRYLVIGFASGDVPKPRVNHLLVKNIDVIGFYWGGYTRFAPEVLRESLTELMTWHAEGRLHPHISHVLPFDQIEDGLDLLRSRKATGKVVIEVTP